MPRKRYFGWKSVACVGVILIGTLRLFRWLLVEPG